VRVRIVLNNKGEHENRCVAIVSIYPEIGSAVQTVSERTKKTNEIFRKALAYFAARGIAALPY